MKFPHSTCDCIDGMYWSGDRPQAATPIDESLPLTQYLIAVARDIAALKPARDIGTLCRRCDYWDQAPVMRPYEPDHDYPPAWL